MSPTAFLLFFVGPVRVLMMRRRTGAATCARMRLKVIKTVYPVFLWVVFFVFASRKPSITFRLKRTQQASTSCDGGGWLMLSRLWNCFFAQTRDTFLSCVYVCLTACPSVCLSLSVVTRGLTTYTQRNEKCPLIDVATTAAPAAGLLYSASFGWFINHTSGNGSRSSF